MANPTHRIVNDPSVFDAYCHRHTVSPDVALAELVNMALGLPVEVVDYLREQRAAGGAAA